MQWQDRMVNNLEGKSNSFLIQRFLVTKFVREGKLNSVDQSLLFSSTFEANILYEKAPKRYESWRQFLELTSGFIQFLYAPDQKHNGILVEYIKQLHRAYGNLIINPRQFLGLRGNPRFKKCLVNSYKVLTERPPAPPARIGVGYSDKGTRRLLSKDGSPSLSEIAGDDSIRQSWLNGEVELKSRPRLPISRLEELVRNRSKSFRKLRKFRKWRRGSLLD